MKKSVYSVVLADDVVGEIDRLAYINNTNRSNMINQILADYVSLVTPEKRISGIFEELARCLYSGETFREFAPPTPSVMSVRSALSYKYNPTVRYTVELFKEPTAEQGVIKVSTRTSNAVLLCQMLKFYELFARIESKFGFSGKSYYEDGVFVRPIIKRKNPLYNKGGEDFTAGAVIANYIYLLDRSMKMFFSDPDNAAQNIAEAYSKYLRDNSEII